MLARALVRRFHGHRFTALRRHTISRIAALWLLSLILIPFTAPFRTFDLASSPVGQRYDTIPKDKADCDDAVPPPPMQVPLVLAPSDVIVSSPLASIAIRPAFRLVLRI